MVVRRDEPLNFEVRIERLVGGIVVTNEDFYVRNHFPVPSVDTAAWRFRIHGLVERPLSLSLTDLMNMPAHTMLLTLECAGNGRSFFEPPIEGEQWALGAVSTAEWTGVLLRELIERAGVKAPARELVFRGADSFERSLLLEDAEERPVLLAYAMNGEPLPANHGQPLRAVVPGWYSVSGVKWLHEVEVVEGPFQGYFQTERYVYDGQRGREPVRYQRVRSLITHPAEGDQVSGETVLRGLAWSGTAPIRRVEVSVGGRDWRDAQLLGEEVPYCWRRWELTAEVPRSGSFSIRSRATDAQGNTQPEHAEWNRLGYGNNSIQEVTIRGG